MERKNEKQNNKAAKKIKGTGRKQKAKQNNVSRETDEIKQ